MDASSSPSPEKETSKDSKRHPLLQRHYSTIGIGDVFLSKPPPHALPSIYLKGDDSDLSQEEDFTSWELVGSIKSSPSDFVVREIGSVKGRVIPGLSTEQVESLRIADLLPISEATSWDETEDRVETKHRVKNQASSLGVSTETEIGAAADTLRKQLEYAEDDGADSILEALDQLDTEAKEWIKQTAEKSAIEHGALPGGFSVSFREANQSTECVASFDRGVFHRSLRLAYSLLNAEAETSNTGSEKQKKYRVRITVDDRFLGLIPSLYEPWVDLPALYLFLKRGFDPVGRETILKLRPDLPRSERRPIHQEIDSKSNSALATTTIPDFRLPNQHADASRSTTTAAIVVQWSKIASRRAAKKRKRHADQQQPHDKDRYPHTLFVMKKTQKEHLAAIQTLCAGLKCRQADIGLAGIKDMHAVSYQFCTLKNFSPKRLIRAAGYLNERGIEIGTVHKVDWWLEKAQLEGNRFEIVIRNIKQVHVKIENGVAKEELVSSDESHIGAMVDRLRKFGFINFYGEQRVGAAGIDSIVGVRAFDIGRAILQGDFEKAVDLLMTGRLVCRGSDTESDEVRAARKEWKQSGGDPFATWKKLPRGNSMSRERLVLKGLKRYGKNDPLSAFKCLHYNERMFFINAYQSYVWNAMATERIQRYGMKVVPGDLILRSSDDSVVEVVTENMLNVSFRDIVMPMPGYQVKYPTNEIGELYADMLMREGVFLKKDAPPESTAKGSYRRLVATVDNLSFETTETETGLNLKLQFDLPKGSYATMFLRELMLTTVDRN